MTNGINIFTDQIKTDFLKQIGDVDDYSQAELTKKASDFIEKSKEDGLIDTSISSSAALSELNQLLSENKDGIKSDGTAAQQGAASKVDVEERIAQLTDKYTYDVVKNSRTETRKNAFAAMEEMLNDGVIKQLALEGYSKADITKMMIEVFPDIVSSTNGDEGYKVTAGRDPKNNEIMDAFVRQMGSLDILTSAEYQEKLARLNELSGNVDINNAKIKNLKSEIEYLQREIEREVEESIQKSKEIAEDQKEEAAKITRNELRNYANSDGEMTYEDFQKGLNKKLDALSADGSSAISAAVNNMLYATAKMDVLSDYIGQMGTLIAENKKYDQTSQELADLENEIANLTNAAESAGIDDDATCCDPIGFNKDGQKFDFFLDKDNNGMLSNEKEFLGANNNWDEMVALDTDGDGKVTASEMKDLKMVVTNEDGSQTVKEASELFNDDTDFIDLSTYQSKNEDIGNNNTLLGTFNVTIDGQEIADGYNTLDDVDWLKQNYNFSDENPEGENFFSAEMAQYEKDLEQYQENYAVLDEKVNQGWKEIGVERDEVTTKIKKDSIDYQRAEGLLIKQTKEDEAKKLEEQEEVENEQPVEVEDETGELEEPEDVLKRKDEKDE